MDLVQNSANEQVRSGPIMTLPLLTIADYSHLLRDVPVCQVRSAGKLVCILSLGLEYINEIL